MLDDAVRAEVNYHRCRAGLPALKSAGAPLAKQARLHSRFHDNAVQGSAPCTAFSCALAYYRRWRAVRVSQSVIAPT